MENVNQLPSFAINYPFVEIFDRQGRNFMLRMLAQKYFLICPVDNYNCHAYLSVINRIYHNDCV